MIFPRNDQYWLNTLKFLQENVEHSDNILAPIEFVQEIQGVTSYDDYFLHELDEYKWLVIHKNQISELDYKIINIIENDQLMPVFANEVFVVFCISGNLNMNKIEKTNPHVQALKNQLKEIVLKITQVSENKLAKKRIANVSDIRKLTRKELEEISFDNCQTAYVGNKTLICRVLNKYIFYCDAEDTNITPHFALQGYWETWITLAIARVVQKGWYCIDIGANHGYYSVIMADAVGSSGKVVAIEPNPKLAKLLKQTTDVNGFQAHTTIIQKAVLDIDAEKINLVLPGGRALNASVTLTPTSLDQDTYSFEVETITIDNLTADWPSVDFIKIDAEGAEEKIWRGMTETLRRNKNIKILLEFNCQRYSNPSRFLEDIQASGFKLRYVDYDASIKDLTIEQCLKEKSDGDVMLLLCRN